MRLSSKAVQHILKPFAVVVLIAASLLIVSQAKEATQTGVIVRTALLKASPSFGSKTLHTASVGSSALLNKRKGGWQQVTLLPEKNIQGWIRTYQIRTDIEPKEVVVERRSSDTETLSGLSGLSRRTASLFGRREMSSNNQSLTAAMGVRGLSESDLENARPNAEQLESFKEYAAAVSLAKSFAVEAGLKAKKVRALPKPKKKKKKRKRKED